MKMKFWQTHKRVFGVMALVFTIGSAGWTMAAAQEAGDRASESRVAQDDGPTLTSIRELITTNRLDQALADLRQATDANPGQPWLGSARSMLASALQRQNRAGEAIDLLKTSFDQALEAPLAPGAMNQLFSNLMSLDMLLRQQGETAAAESNLQLVIGAIKAEQANATEANTNTQLLMNVYAFAARTVDRATVESWYQSELQRVEGLYNAAPDGPHAIAAYLNALATIAFPAYDAGRPQEEFVQKLLDVAPAVMERQLESPQVLAAYQSAITRVINSLMRDDPTRADGALQQAKTLLERAKEKQANSVVAERALQTLVSLEPRILAAMKQLAMIGAPAPAFDAMAWANGQAGSLSDLEGKVVLLDFWAVWCGPCIATFPHLREWHDQYASQGLAIVGVTRQYNYAWDDTTKRASKAEGEVSLDDELKMLEQFIQHHELRHPTLVTPAGSAMQGEYGVTGIPHAVLIDKQGRVRMIKVGSGQANADALHQMIEALLAE